MSISHNFKIKPQMASALVVGGVTLHNVCTFLTHVACEAVDGDRKAEVFSFACPVKLGAPDPDTFIPEAKLTGDDLLGWASKVMGQAEIDDLKARATAALSNIVSPAPVAGREFVTSPAKQA